MQRMSPERRADVLLAAAGIVLGVLAAAAYALFRAFTLDDASGGDRLSEFSGEMLFPGVLVIVAVAAMVWMGWKLDID